MKVRNGWVSNSSSSSFIIFPKKENDFKMEKSPSITIGNGITEFGWEFNDYTDTQTKANWAFLQILYMRYQWDFPESVCLESIERRLKIAENWETCFEMFENVLRKGYENVTYNLYISEYHWNPIHGYYITHGIKDSFYGEYIPGLNYGSIDHQSQFFDNLDLKRIFDSEEKLYHFLFDNEVVLQNGNDNE